MEHGLCSWRFSPRLSFPGQLSRCKDWAAGWTTKDLCFDSRRGLLHGVQTESVDHPAFYPVDPKVSFPGSKAAGALS
jgi:hypothetical protein